MTVIDGECGGSVYGVWVRGGGSALICGGEIFGQQQAVYVDSGSAVITGGSFSTDPSAYVAEGYEATENAETGMWTVSAATDDGEVVAWIDRDNDGEIGSEEETYASLQEAVDSIAAMAVADNTILKLNEDVELDETSVTVSSGVLTLDLNGKTISRTPGGGNALEIMGGTVTVTDSAAQKTGAISAANSAILMNGGTLTIEGGNISGYSAIYTCGGSMTVSGGTITGSQEGIYVCCPNGGDVTIENGEISGDRYGVRVDGGNANVNVSGGTVYGFYSGLQMDQGHAFVTGGKVSSRYSGVELFGGSVTVENGEISGGTFTGGQDTATNNYEGVFVWDGSATITGGSFNSDPSAYVAENCEAVLNEETGYYDVRESDSSSLKIVAQPVDYVGMVGEVAEFDVIAKGEGLTYQWYYFDRNVSQWKKSSSTEGYLDVEFKAYRNGQQYKCVITDALGNTVETDVVSILAKEIELMIDEQPVSHVGAVNDQVVFSCGAVGNGLLYQWYYSTDGGENWMMSGSPGYNTDTLLPILRAYRNGQQYYCRITDVFGNVVETDVVDMTVRSSEVVIVKQPETVEYGLLGQLYYFTVDAEGDNLTYQWEVSKDGGETWEKSYNDGCDTARLSVRLYAYRSGYQYRCVVSSGLKNTVVTDAAVLKLQPASVKIVTEPVSRGFMVQKNVHFNVEAEGMDLTYQWYRSNDGGNTWVKTYLDGYDTDTLYFKATAARCALYRCYVTDGSGTEAYAKAAKLTLIDKELVLLRQPEDVYCQNGDTAVFAVEAEGAGLKYQWYASADGGETWAVTWLGGSDTDTLSFKVNETRAAKLYKCVITDAGNNTVETEPVSVTIMDGELPESSSTVKEVSPIMLNGELRWQFDVLLENTGFTNLTLDQVLVTKYQGGTGGTMVASDTFGKERLPELHLADENGPLKLAPGETHVWGDGHPVVEDFDCIEYVFMFTYDNGKQAVKTYTYTLLDGWTEAAVDCFGRPGTIFHNNNGSMFYTDAPDAITTDGTNPFAKVEDIAVVYHNGERHEYFDAGELGKGVRAEKYGSTLVLIDSFMTVVVQTSVRYGTATLEDGTVIKNTGYEPGDVVAIQLCDGSCVGDSAIQYDGHCGSYVHCNWFAVVEPQTIVVDQAVSMVSRPANSYIVADSGISYYYSGNLNKDLAVNDSAADDNGIMSWSAKGRTMNVYCDEYGYIQYWCAVPAPAPVMQVGYFVENTNTAKLKDSVVNQPLESSYDYTVDVVGMDAVCTNIQTTSNTYHLMVERSYDTQGVWCGGILALYGANGDIAMTAAVAGQETYLDRTTGELVGESFVDGMNYHVSNNTQFLIRTWDFASGWYSYQAVTGYKGVPEYLGKVALGGTAYSTIQYLDTNGDGIIDYLFVDAFYVREAEVIVQIVELEMKASVAELGRLFPYLDVYTAYIDGMLCYVAYYDMNGIPLESGKLYRTVAQAVGATYMGEPIYVAMEAC